MVGRKLLSCRDLELRSTRLQSKMLEQWITLHQRRIVTE